jgi:hypothetical protein
MRVCTLPFLAFLGASCKSESGQVASQCDEASRSRARLYVTAVPESQSVDQPLIVRGISDATTLPVVAISVLGEDVPQTDGGFYRWSASVTSANVAAATAVERLTAIAAVKEQGGGEAEFTFSVPLTIDVVAFDLCGDRVEVVCANGAGADVDGADPYNPACLTIDVSQTVSPPPESEADEGDTGGEVDDSGGAVEDSGGLTEPSGALPGG